MRIRKRSVQPSRKRLLRRHPVQEPLAHDRAKDRKHGDRQDVSDELVCLIIERTDELRRRCGKGNRAMSEKGKALNDAERQQLIERIVGDSAPTVAKYTTGGALVFELSTNLATAAAPRA